MLTPFYTHLPAYFFSSCTCMCACMRLHTHTHTLVKSNSSSILCLAKYEVLNVADKTQNSADRFHVIIITMSLKWASSAAQQPTTFISLTDIPNSHSLKRPFHAFFSQQFLFLLAKNFVSCFMEEIKSIRPELLHLSPPPLFCHPTTFVLEYSVLPTKDRVSVHATM